MNHRGALNLAYVPMATFELRSELDGVMAGHNLIDHLASVNILRGETKR